MRYSVTIWVAYLTMLLLRNGRKAESGIACPEIVLGCAVNAHKSYVRAHPYTYYTVRTVVPAPVSREGIEGWVWGKRKITIQCFAGSRSRVVLVFAFLVVRVCVRGLGVDKIRWMPFAILS